MSVAAVVLAAGASTRLGEPKQLVRLGGETLLERAVRVAREAWCEPVVVVLGASAAVIQQECRLGDARVVVNEDWASGMGGSIGVGVRTLKDVDGCVVMTCDMPAVTASHLRALMEGRDAGEVVASSYAGRRGVPAYFPASSFVELKAVRGDVGARGVLQGAKCVELVGGELDVDAAGDLERVRELFDVREGFSFD
ncbi:MAG TPA: nucleotidyltransferase family protein [Edaphobacter sp.]|nr:nucleotidyltransferase family protein [Edaphobacter sp.]